MPLVEPSLLRFLPDEATPGALLDGFIDHAADQGIELYDHQEEAILELLDGSNVILATPTGSGKSLVAEAAHFAALAAGKRSWYTAPIKALVSEKFFALCRRFGSDNVGMITGDASVNADAPIIACTAEILANAALRHGADAPVDVAIMDEFHYYGDPQRGWAWQVPLLELPHTQFLLMSATLGPTNLLEADLTDRTGIPTVTVSSDQRPVPLEFEYRQTPIHQSLQELLDLDRAPVYIVHFTQRAATEAAQALTSLDVLTKPQKAEINEAIGGFRFDSPIGKDLRRWLSHGIGVHHAGLLPKYRLLVEKLAQQGLLKLIAGTDTLGVGVNVPIRTVLFTQLCKYDGVSTRSLQNREFQQIAGRAGRRGFDDQGYVWVQAPAHNIENLVAEAKAATDPKKRKKLVKKKPPERGYSHWDEKSFTKMMDGQPEPLQSHFKVGHQFMLEVLDRPGDGCAAVRHLLTDNHETRKRQRGHIRRSIAIYRSLLDAGVVEHLDEPDEQGRRVRVTIDLQADFALHQPLSLFAVEAVEALSSSGLPPELAGGANVAAVDEPEGATADHPEPATADQRANSGGSPENETGAIADEPEPATADAESTAPPDPLESSGGSPENENSPESDPALDVLSVIESVLENPGVILHAQVSKAKDALVADMKSRGIEYEERMERLDEVTYPKPLAPFLYAAFDTFRAAHPWVGSDNVAPKSIARDLYEQAMTFREYVNHYGLKRSEGAVLRYLSDAYKAMVQNVPEAAKTDEVIDLTEWLGEVVRQVDSSLLDEWERIRNPEVDIAEVRPPGIDDDRPDVTRNARAFRVMVRNETFRWVTMLARKAYMGLAEHQAEMNGIYRADDLREAMEPYWESYDAILLDADARSVRNAIIDEAATVWNVTQILSDPDENNEWRLIGEVDLDASREAGAAIVRLTDITRL